MGSCCIKEDELGSDPESSPNRALKSKKNEHTPLPTDNPFNAHAKNHYGNKINLEEEILSKSFKDEIPPDNEYYCPRYGEKDAKNHGFKEINPKSEKKNQELPPDHYKDIENRLTTAENELKTTENELKTAENKLKTTENKLKEAENELENAENEIQANKEELEKVKQEKAKIKKKYQQLKISHKECIENIKNTITDNTDLIKQLDESKAYIVYLAKLNDDNEIFISKYKIDLSELRNQNTKLNEEIETLSQKFDKNQDIIERKDAKINKFKTEIEMKDQIITKLSDDRQSFIKKIQDIEENNRKMIENNINLSKTNTKLTNEVNSLKDEKKESDKNYKSIENKFKEYENKIVGITVEVFKSDEVRALKSELEIVRANLVEIEEKYLELQKKWVETKYGDSTEYYKKVITELQSTINYSGYY